MDERGVLVKWHRCELTVPSDAVDSTRGALLLAQMAGWEERETEEGMTFVVYLPADGNGALGKIRELGELTCSTVDDEDWAHSWKRFWKPQRIGQSMVVVPSWEKFERMPDDHVIELDPGMAFGTGTHETTRMCMEVLERVVSPGDYVCDVGCGSGILTITALLLGASRVVAVDNDPICTRTTRENLERNALWSDAVQVRQGQGFIALDASGFNVIVANIAANAVIALAPEVPLKLAPGGVFIGSGIIEARIVDVDAALAAAGLSSREWHRDGEWATVEARLS